MSHSSGSSKEKPVFVSVIIPCLNEAATIEEVVKRAYVGLRKANVQGEVIVADNMSTDTSVELAQKQQATIIKVQLPGYGAVLDSAIRSCKHRVVVIGDADLSYCFEQLGRLVEPVLKGEASLVIGNRFAGTMQKGAMPFLNRYLGTPVLSALIRFVCSITIRDCNSGFRCLNADTYKTLTFHQKGMEYASEMIMKFASNRLVIKEVPIDFFKDGRNRPPHLRRWRDGFRHLRVIVHLGVIRRFKTSKPLLAEFKGL